MRVACAGEAMVELSLHGDGAGLGFAGDVLNSAIYLRRELPAEHEVAFVSVLGGDVLSRRMIGFIESEGVDARRVTLHPERLPGLYAIDTDPDGERSFLYWRENSAARTMFRGPDGGPDFSALDSVDVLYFSAITLAVLPEEVRVALFSWIDGFRRSGGRVAFDSNYRPRLWENRETARETVMQAWRRCDIGLPSLDDEIALFGDGDAAKVLARLQGAGVAAGALKRGAEGPLPLSGSLGGQVFSPADRVVDTTAAGDSFNGAYLACWLMTGDAAAAMAAGHDCARRVIGYPGAIIPA